MVCRTIVLRVRPDALIAFEPNIYSDNAEDDDNENSGFVARVKKSCNESQSLLSWADAGQWVTAKRAYTGFSPDDDWVEANADEDALRQGNRFRIGFEPLFVDFTKAGSWFMVYSLVQVRTLVETVETTVRLRYPHKIGRHDHSHIYLRTRKMHHRAKRLIWVPHDSQVS